MPEHLRAYIVIMIIALASFSLLKKFATYHISTKEFQQYRIAWLVSTSIAFLAHNFWLFLILMLFYSSFLRKKIEYNIALFALILFIAPQIKGTIGGIGLKYILTVDYVRVITVAVLLPIFIKLINSNKSLKLGKSKTDIFVLLYAVIYLLGQARSTTGTDLIRHFIYFLIDFFIPYYVASRSIKNINQLNTVLVAFFTAVIVSSNIGIFEHIKTWLLYSRLDEALSTPFRLGGYLGRGDSLRAVSSFGMPISFGYMVTIAIGVFLYLQIKIKNKSHKRLVGLILLLALYAPVSRGPWVGALLLYLSYLLMSKSAMKNILKFSIVSLTVFAVILVSPYREKAINLIPFVGKTDQHNVDYRKDLIRVTSKIIAKNPILGSSNYLDDPLITELYQGDVSNAAIKVDIVNTYILVALQNGFLGLFIYVMMYLSALFGLLRALSRIKDKSNPNYILGVVLISILISMMTMIMTVSPVMTIPVVNYMFLGISVAYSRILISTNKIT